MLIPSTLLVWDGLNFRTTRRSPNVIPRRLVLGGRFIDRCLSFLYRRFLDRLGLGLGLGLGLRLGSGSGSGSAGASVDITSSTGSTAGAISSGGHQRRVNAQPLGNQRRCALLPMLVNQRQVGGHHSGLKQLLHGSGDGVQ